MVQFSKALVVWVLFGGGGGEKTLSDFLFTFIHHKNYENLILVNYNSTVQKWQKGTFVKKDSKCKKEGPHLLSKNNGNLLVYFKNLFVF